VVVRTIMAEARLFIAAFTAERLSEWTQDVDSRIQCAVDFGKKRNYLKGGDTIVIVTGWRKGAGATNTMRIITVQ